jgi:hypothetical protein
MKILAQIQNNQIVHSHDLSELNGEVVECNISKIGKKRSVHQNSYYWSLVIPIICDALNNAGFSVKFGKLEMEFTDESVHELLCKGYFLKKYKKKSTTELTTIEFEDLMRDIRNWASVQLELCIPEPNENIDNLFAQISQYEAERKSNLKQY